MDLVVTELAVISYATGGAVLLETAPGVSVQDVQAATEGRLTVPEQVGRMAIGEGVRAP